MINEWSISTVENIDASIDEWIRRGTLLNGKISFLVLFCSDWVDQIKWEINQALINDHRVVLIEFNILFDLSLIINKFQSTIEVAEIGLWNLANVSKRLMTIICQSAGDDLCYLMGMIRRGVSVDFWLFIGKVEVWTSKFVSNWKEHISLSFWW